jgi:hypothetical protein
MTTPTDESTTGEPEPEPVPEHVADGNVPDRTADNHGMSIRDANLILARAHLRFGLLGLARAELETMAGRDELDDDGIRDLAEARWRTGDTTGAGEAAVAYLEVVPDDVVALVIAAEAQADLGRPGEARRLAGLAMELADGSLDPIFAGMRRSSIWPVEGAVGATGPIGLLFNELHPGPVTPAPGLDRRATDRPTNGHVAPYAPLDPALPAAFAVGPEAGPGLWDDVPDAALAADAVEADPTELFHRARLALDHGQPAAAATGLTLALRTSPELAPAVLDLLSGRSEPILLLVRGDAYQIVGRDVEAMRDHAAAASGLATDRTMAAPITVPVPAAAAPAELEPPTEAPLESGGDPPDPDHRPIGVTEHSPDGTTADPAHEGSDPTTSTDPEPPMPDQEDS